MKIDLNSETLKLRENPNVSYDDAEEMYSCYGAHITTEEHGDICVQAVDYDWMDCTNTADTWRTEQLASLDGITLGDFADCDDLPQVDATDAIRRGDEVDLQSLIDYFRADDYPDENLEAAGNELADTIEAALEQVKEINQWAEKTDDYAVLMLRKEYRAGRSRQMLGWYDCEELVELARRVRGDMEPIAELLEQAASAAVDEDLEACVEALRNASNLETDHGDDPSTSGLASQLLAEME